MRVFFLHLSFPLTIGCLQNLRDPVAQSLPIHFWVQSFSLAFVLLSVLIKCVHISSPSSSTQEEGTLFCCLGWIKTSGSLHFSVAVWLSWVCLWHMASTEPYRLGAVSEPFQHIPLPPPTLLWVVAATVA